MYNKVIKWKSLTITVDFANFAKITGRPFEAWVRTRLRSCKPDSVILKLHLMFKIYPQWGTLIPWSETGKDNFP